MLIPGYDDDHQDFDDAINALKVALKKRLPFKGEEGEEEISNSSPKKRRPGKK